MVTKQCEFIVVIVFEKLVINASNKAFLVYKSIFNLSKYTMSAIHLQLLPHTWYRITRDMTTKSYIPTRLSIHHLRLNLQINNYVK